MYCFIHSIKNYTIDNSSNQSATNLHTRKHKMKKTKLILTALCTLFTTTLTYTAPNDKAKKTQTLKLSASNNIQTLDYVEDGITHLNLSIGCSNNAAIEVHIPLSVKKINLSGGVSNNAKLILYMSHHPVINKNMYHFNNGTIQIMHPMRQYTYHAIATSIVLGGIWWFYSKSD